MKRENRMKCGLVIRVGLKPTTTISLPVAEQPPHGQQCHPHGWFPSRKRRLALARQRGTLGEGGVSRESCRDGRVHPLIPINKRRVYKDKLPPITHGQYARREFVMAG